LRLPQRRQHPRDRRRQRRLPVVHVPDRPHVDVRLRPLKLRLRHPPASPAALRLCPYPLTPARVVRASAMFFGPSSQWENSIVYAARPWVLHRTAVAYPNISASRTSTPTIRRFPRCPIAVLQPLRAWRPP